MFTRQINSVKVLSILALCLFLFKSNAVGVVIPGNEGKVNIQVKNSTSFPIIPYIKYIPSEAIGTFSILACPPNINVGEVGTITCGIKIKDTVPLGTSTKLSFIIGSNVQGFLEEKRLLIPLKIGQRINLVSPTSGTIGTIVTVKGEDYLASEQVRIDFGETKSITFTNANSNGSFTTTFTINLQRYGIKTITAVGVLSKAIAYGLFDIKPMPGTISGRVAMVETGNPIKGVKIEVLQNNTVKGSATTSENGTYMISDLSSGSYSITAVINGIYQIKEGIIVNSGKETQDINFVFNECYDNLETKIDDDTRSGRSKEWYVYPFNPRYKIYKWSYCVYENNYSRDDGTYIDYAKNKLVIKVRLDGKWYRKAKHKATYTIYTRCQIGDEVNRAPYSESKETIIENKKSIRISDAVIMLMHGEQIQEKRQSQRLQASSLKENSNIAIMLKDIEEELTTVKLKLSFNSDSMRIGDVNLPIFEDDEMKAHFQQKEIDNQNGKIEMTVIIIDEGIKGTIADKIFPIEDEATGEEQNIAPIAHLIVDTTMVSKKAKSLRDSSTIDKSNWISIDNVELTDTDGNIIEVKIDTGNIVKPIYESNLEKVYCYPNPTKNKITFANLTERVKVKIFNIAGELVYGEYEHQSDVNAQWSWDCRNNAGEKVASGIYSYILQDNVSRSMKRGKLGVVR